MSVRADTFAVTFVVQFPNDKYFLFHLKPLKEIQKVFAITTVVMVMVAVKVTTNKNGKKIASVQLKTLYCSFVVWSYDKLANKIYDMRDVYNQCVEDNIPFSETVSTVSQCFWLNFNISGDIKQKIDSYIKDLLRCCEVKKEALVCCQAD